MPDRETVMSWLEGLADDDWRQYHSDSEVQEIARNAIAFLREQEPVKPISRMPTVGGWISVKDRMPELGQPVLFTGKSSYGTQFITQRGWYDGTFWCRDAGETLYSSTPVTHWMPLPEPPEEVSA